jgi:AcrR family transcriptional regulator
MTSSERRDGDPPGSDRADGRRRWLLAGQQLLREGGVPAVKLVALVQATGLTTGSFYHHFDGMPAYLDELARFYGSERAEELLRTIDDADPRARLAQLSRLARDERMAPLDAAMRDWAGSNDVAASAVRSSDDVLLRFMERALRDLGHDRADARLRAVVLLSTGVARVHAPWKLPAHAGERVLDLVTGAAQPEETSP